MALSSYWVSQHRKDLAERAIVAKREREAARAQVCRDIDSYHKETALRTSKYKSIEEFQGLKNSKANEESRVKERLKHAAKEKVECRRHRLAHILAVENEQYMKELKEMKDNERETDPWNISRLKEQIADLQRKRKEGEQNIQKRYMHHVFSSTIATANEDVNQQLQREVSEAWKQRKEELEKLNIEKQEKEKERHQILESQQLKFVQEAQNIEVEKSEEQEKWTSVIHSKMNELKSAEIESNKLKAEKEILIRHLETLLSLQRRRASVQDLKKKALQRLQTMWQPKEKLRRIQVEVLHSLDFDLKQLVNILAFNSSATEDSALALLNLESAVDVKNKIEMQIALEKNREDEIQRLYNEEASKLLTKQLEQWSLESIARDEIMNELFKTLANEINSKIELNIDQEKKFILMKEAYLKEIDETSKKAKDGIETLNEKHRYYLDRARQLSEELEPKCDTKSEPRLSRPSSCRTQSSLNFFS